MANTKPLSLKRQRAALKVARNLQLKAGQLQAEVFIDTGVFHLEQEFSYLVPEELGQNIKVGSIVKVPFKSDFKLGVVSEIGAVSKTNLLSIDRIVEANGLTAKHIAFARAVANRYVATLPQVLQLMFSGINPRSVSSSSVIPPELTTKIAPRREFIEISKPQQLTDEIELTLASQRNGSTLLIFPSINLMRTVISKFKFASDQQVVEFGSHLSAAERKAAWSKIIGGSNLIIFGLRGAIFAPIKDLAQIMVLDEFSNSYFEQRRPYWNLRDVALLRSESEGCDLVFIGNSCSLELWRLIDKEWFKYRSSKISFKNVPRRVIAASSSFHSTVREGLKTGPVLVCVAGKEYASGFVCSQCRNRARCKCGGYLYLTEKDMCACSICDFQSSDWRCSECASNKILVYRSGAKKLLTELGKTFPNEKLLINTGDKPLGEEISGRCIVVSTYGVEPIASEGYSAVVLLDGEFLTARRHIRAEEETFNSWQRALGLLREGGQVYVSLMEKHPITQSITARRNSIYLNSALRERSDVRLPPLSRVICVQGESREISGLRRKISIEFEKCVEIHSSLSGRELTIKVEHQAATQLLLALKALQKMRSASNKELFELKVDPFTF